MDLLRYRDELIVTKIPNNRETGPFKKRVTALLSENLDWSLDILPVIPATKTGNNHMGLNNVDELIDSPQNNSSSYDEDQSGSPDEEYENGVDGDDSLSVADETDYTTDMLPAAFCEATVCRDEVDSSKLEAVNKISNDSLISGEPQTKKKKFCCTECSYSTDVSSHFRAHKRRHTGERPYACPLCPYRAAESCTLNRHKLTHSGAKKHRCPLCPYRAFLAGDVAKHMRCHTGERPYSCPLCPYRASRRSSVKEHLATHAISKEYPCDVCGHKCATRIQLRRHVKNKHFFSSISHS